MSGALIMLDQAQPADPSVIPLQQAQPAPGAGNGVGSFLSTAGINALSGVAATPNLIAQGVDWAGRHTVGDPGLSTMQAPWSNGHSILPDYQTVRQGLFDKTGATEFQPQSAAERYGLAAASAIPAVLAGGGLSAAGRAVTGDLAGAGAALGNAARAVPAAAGAGAGAELGKEITPGYPIVGGLIGALAGGKAGQLAANVPLGAAMGPAGGSLPVEDAQLAQGVRAQGVPLGVAQVSGNEWLRRLATMGGKLPMSGTGAFAEGQQQGFNNAVARTINPGTDATRVTAEFLNAERQRIGGNFNAIAARTSIPMDNQFMTDLQGVVDRARMNLSADSVAPVERQAMNVVDTAANNHGDLGGRAFIDLTAKGGPIDTLQQSSDSGMRAAGNQLRNVVETAMQRNAAAGDQVALMLARGQWKALRTIEPLTLRADTPGGPSPSVGDISPAALRGAVNRSYNKNALAEGTTGGAGPALDTLARGGQRFLKEPSSSGTAENTMAGHALEGLGGLALAGGAHEAGAPLIASLGGTLGTAVANRALQALLRNQWLADRTIRASLNPDGFRFTGPRVGQSLPFSFAPAIGPPQQ